MMLSWKGVSGCTHVYVHLCILLLASNLNKFASKVEVPRIIRCKWFCESIQIREK